MAYDAILDSRNEYTTPIIVRFSDGRFAIRKSELNCAGGLVRYWYKHRHTPEWVSHSNVKEAVYSTLYLAESDLDALINPDYGTPV